MRVMFLISCVLIILIYARRHTVTSAGGGGTWKIVIVKLFFKVTENKNFELNVQFVKMEICTLQSCFEFKMNTRCVDLKIVTHEFR